jgi:hypothetical protein
MRSGVAERLQLPDAMASIVEWTQRAVCGAIDVESPD